MLRKVKANEEINNNWKSKQFKKTNKSFVTTGGEDKEKRNLRQTNKQINKQNIEINK